MNIVKATRRFEEWLNKQTKVVKADLVLKHQRMAESPFPFFRATFYRWIQLWPDVCSDLCKAPSVLAVGDLHVENFGTWRDIEGRLVWGINDFDETARLPYTVDLTRLAASAMLAAEEGHLALKPKDACTAILDGYRESLVEQGRPFVLEEEHAWLRAIALNELRDPVHFWQRMDQLPRFAAPVPTTAKRAIERLLPEKGLSYKMAKRVAGLGSLGHMRIVAVALCRGGRIAREAKALVPSAVYWVTKKKRYKRILYGEILQHSVRDPDPFVELHGRWIVRRLSPHCSRIELSVLPRDRDELRLLFSMGWECANVHLGTAAARKQIRRHLDRLRPGVVASATEEMVKHVHRDWRDWKESIGPTS